MDMKKLLLTLIATFLVTGSYGAALTKASFTQVVNQVRVVSAGSRAIRPAVLKAEFNTPDLIQTGPRSLAELTAPDKTITRVGSNTIFSYAKSGRNINLQKGSLLFHSPRGKGGGVIRTKAASASVLGTTLIVSATVDGGFKCVVLEGKAALQMPNGNYRVARAGQVVFVPAGGVKFGPTVDVKLEKLVEESNLVQSFEEDLPSLPKIKKAVVIQEKMIEEGELTPQKDEAVLAPTAGAPEGDSVPTVTKETVEAAVLSFADKFRTAIGTSASISGTPFPSAQVFTDPYNTSIPGLSQNSFKGLLGRNLSFTPASGQSGVQLDFSQYIAGQTFDVLADATLNITGPSIGIFASQIQSTLTTSGGEVFNPDFELKLIGRTGVNVASGTQIFANHVGNFGLFSGTSMRLDNVSIYNGSRSLTVGANTTLELVNGGTYSAVNSGHSVTVRSAAGSVYANGASASVPVVFQAPTVNMLAAKVLSLNTVSFQNVATVALEATTINLQNINWANGTSVSLSSALGLLAAHPNTGAASVPGHVNFINNVLYAGDPAQDFVGSNIQISARP